MTLVIVWSVLGQRIRQGAVGVTETASEMGYELRLKRKEEVWVGEGMTSSWLRALKGQGLESTPPPMLTTSH